MAEWADAVNPAPRHRFADLLRGLLVSHMALDHSSMFWNARRFADEFWDHLPPAHDLPNFLARFSGFPVAPGFSFMAGFMVAVTDAARAARGDSESAVRRRLLFRAGLLVAIELVFFSLATGRVQVGVLTCLGVCLAITTFLRQMSGRTLAIAAIAILALHPLLRGLWTDRLDAAGIAIKVLHQAGKFPEFDVYYPLIPWIGVMLLGVAAGRRWISRGSRDWPLVAGLFAAAFLVTRLFGVGSAGPSAAIDTYAFWIWSKYPPDLPWLSASFAVLFATLWLLERAESTRFMASAPVEFIATFGRVPLFFYAGHFVVLWAARPREQEGLGVAIVVWIALLAAMWWPCRAWHGIRTRRRNGFQIPGPSV